MVELIRGLDASRVRANLERVREQITATAADSASNRGERDRIEVLAAVKYVPNEELSVLHDAGIRLVGENRAQELQQKALAHPDLFEWHFIGQLQSRKVKAIVPHASLIHSVASESALRELERHRELAMPGMEILLEVNVAGEEGKAGIAPQDIDCFIEASVFPSAV